MRQDSVGVIIVNYKTFIKTEKCVKSFLKSDYKNFFIYIVDNGSDDESVDYLKRIFKNNQQVRITSLSRNLGYGGGVNKGTRSIKKKPTFYLISNSDVIVDKNCLREIVLAAKENGSKNIYCPVILLSNFKQRIFSAGLNSPIPSPFQFKRLGRRLRDIKTFEVDYLSGTCFLINHVLFEKLKGFEEDYFLYGEDVDLGLRAGQEGTKIIVVPRSKIWHELQGSTSHFSPLSRYYLARNIPRIIQRYMTKKVWNFFVFAFWGIWELLILFLILRWKSVVYYCLGTIDFFRRVKGRSSSQ